MLNFKLHSKNIFIIFILFFCGKIFSQDTIYFRNNEVKSVKVSEVNPTEIKYFRFESLSGPIYTSYTNDIKKIKYAGGHVDSFNVVLQKPNVVSNPINYNANYAYNHTPIEIEFRKRLVYKGHGLNETKLWSLILNYPDQKYSAKMVIEFDVLKKLKGHQHLSGVLGFTIGGAILLAGLVGAQNYNSYPNYQYWLIAGVIGGGSIIVTGQIISGVFKKKRDEQRVLIAKLYNIGLQQ